MDLTAVAGSPAVIALQTLAASDATAAPTRSSPADGATGESLSVTPGASLYGVSQGIGRAMSAADTAGAAGQTILERLDRMRQSAGQATATGLSSVERQALDQSYQADAAGIGSAVRSATIGGANLLDGSLTGGLRTALGDGAQVSLTGLDLTGDGSTLALSGTGLSTPQDAEAARSAVEAAIPAATTALDGLQAQAGQLAVHAALVQSLGETAAVPSGDDGGDGARLLALQVGQQLAAQPSIAIANASPQQVLALFRS